MNDSTFWSSYNNAVKLLNNLELFKDEFPHKKSEYSKNNVECSRCDYKKRYQSIIDNRDYDILLYDDSVLQMSIKDGESRLLYIQVPTYYVSFEKYMVELGFCRYDRSKAYDLFYEEYEQFLAQQQINKGAVYMRYDVSENERKENIHAYTHLHIGIDNDIRIPVGCYLTPFAFVLFVIRHVYYDKWIESISKGKIEDKYLNFKGGCEPLPSELWSEVEKRALYLG